MTRKELVDAALEILSYDMTLCFEYTDAELREMVEQEDSETLLQYLEDNREE